MFQVPGFIRALLGSAPPPDWDVKDLYAEITINPTSGAVKVEAHNGDGVNCLELTKEIEKAMGGAIERQMKPEARMVRRGGGNRITGTEHGTVGH